jgi:hypothetical protein
VSSCHGRFAQVVSQRAGSCDSPRSFRQGASRIGAGQGVDPLAAVPRIHSGCCASCSFRHAARTRGDGVVCRVWRFRTAAVSSCHAHGPRTTEHGPVQGHITPIRPTSTSLPHDQHRRGMRTGTPENPSPPNAGSTGRCFSRGLSSSRKDRGGSASRKRCARQNQSGLRTRDGSSVQRCPCCRRDRRARRLKAAWQLPLQAQ